MVKFTAKEGQDQWVLNTLGHKRNGYFVELGAHNGINDSNTWVLEKEYGWNGICVEPNSRSFEELKTHRNCHLLNCCVTDVNGMVDFVERGRRRQISGVAHDNADIYVQEALDAGHPIVAKQSWTLHSILKKLKAPRVIDYMSIDVEGSEWLALQHFPLWWYRVLCLTIEHNYIEATGYPEANGRKRQMVRNLLETHGYHLYGSVAAEDWYTIWKPMSHPKKRGYNAKYYRRHFEQYRDWERAIARDLVQRYDIHSVIDLGCGVGSYLEGAQEVGVHPLMGVEINYSVSREFTPHNILPYIRKEDITQPLPFGRYDCVWSFETAEHIDPDGTDTFLDNLTSMAKRIILTAAPPGQGGTGHINCRPKEFWIEEIESRGFLYDKKAVEETLEVWNGWKDHKIPGYIKRNLMIFVN